MWDNQSYIFRLIPSVGQGMDDDDDELGKGEEPEEVSFLDSCIHLSSPGHDIWIPPQLFLECFFNPRRLPPITLPYGHNGKLKITFDNPTDNANDMVQQQLLLPAPDE
jgi:hypothetical protein